MRVWCTVHARVFAHVGADPVCGDVVGVGVDDFFESLEGCVSLLELWVWRQWTVVVVVVVVRSGGGGREVE